MTDTAHRYFATAHAYAQTLPLLLGYPSGNSHCHTATVSLSGPVTDALAAQILDVAADTQRDMIHIAYAETEPVPIGLALALRQHSTIQWLPDCTLYAASETATVEILAGGRRWRVGPRNMLTAAKLPPRDRRAAGEAIALRRWHQAVAAGPIGFPGVITMHPGERIADAIARDDLLAAA